MIILLNRKGPSAIFRLPKPPNPQRSNGIHILAKQSNLLKRMTTRRLEPELLKHGMLSSKIDSAYVRHDLERFCQGDILRDISIVQWAARVGDSLSVQERVLPYSVILTQDCDLEQDYNNRLPGNSKNADKYMHSVLLCPAYQAEAVRTGTHLDELNLSMETINSARWQPIKQNNNYRYHFLCGHQDFQVPDLVIDFKHYFTVPRYVLYTENFRASYLASVSELFRESLSIRFAQYLSRIGLPSVQQVADVTAA